MTESVTPNSSAATGASRAPTETPLRIPTRLLQQLILTASRGYPHETCGLLVGEDRGDGVRVEKVRNARNLSHDRLRDRYTLDPRDFLAADAEARRSGLDIIGIWHTHPDHPARPSTTDRDAAWAGYTYMILSVHPGGVGDATAWRLHDGEFVERPIEEVEE